jgi:hypothetical protein
LKIMIVGDVQDDLEALNGLHLVAVRAGCHQIVQLGDFGCEAGDRFFVSELERLDRELARRQITLYWLDGNHDAPGVATYPGAPAVDGVGICHERLAGGGYYERIRFLPRGSRWQWEGSASARLGVIRRSNALWVCRTLRSIPGSSRVPVTSSGPCEADEPTSFLATTVPLSSRRY